LVARPGIRERLDLRAAVSPLTQRGGQLLSGDGQAGARDR